MNNIKLDILNDDHYFFLPAAEVDDDAKHLFLNEYL